MPSNTVPVGMAAVRVDDGSRDDAAAAAAAAIVVSDVGAGGDDEIERVLPLYIAYRVYAGRVPAADAARAFLRARMAAGDCSVFVACSGGSAMGFALVYPTWGSLSMARRYILNDLWVSPEARRRGVGRALVRRAVAFARSAGAGSLVLQTATDNVTAHALYESAGWTRDPFCTYSFKIV